MDGRSTSLEARALDVLHLGLRPYDEVLALMEARVEARHRGEVADALIFCEHPPVVTVGRGGGRADICGDLAAHGIALCEIARGGELTYHGPGQLVIYPVIELAPERHDLHALLRRIEEVCLLSLADFGLAAGRRAGHTGVWMGERKLVSLGIAVRHWVTYHGAAINVALDLEPYKLIRPCGLAPEVMTSMVAQGCDAATVSAVADAFERHFRDVFHKPCAS